MSNCSRTPTDSQCERCQFFAFSEYLVCAVHPQGPILGEICLDFEPWPEGKVLWAPVGTGFYEIEPSPEQGRLPRRTLLEKLEKIEAHPIFSGRCPECGKTLGYEPRYLWNCDYCGWEDDLSD